MVVPCFSITFLHFQTTFAIVHATISQLLGPFLIVFWGTFTFICFPWFPPSKNGTYCKSFSHTPKGDVWRSHTVCDGICKMAAVLIRWYTKVLSSTRTAAFCKAMLPFWPRPLIDSWKAALLCVLAIDWWSNMSSCLPLSIVPLFNQKVCHDGCHQYA